MWWNTLSVLCAPLKLVSMWRRHSLEACIASLVIPSLHYSSVLKEAGQSSITDILWYYFFFTAGQTVTSSSTSTSTSSSFSSSSQTSSSSSFSFSNSSPTPPPTVNAPGQPETNPSEHQPQEVPPELGQLLGSLFGVGGGAGAGPVGAPTITVTTSGVPAFFQGVSEFIQQVSVWILDLRVHFALKFCMFFGCHSVISVTTFTFWNLLNFLMWKNWFKCSSYWHLYFKFQTLPRAHLNASYGTDNLSACTHAVLLIL